MNIITNSRKIIRNKKWRYLMVFPALFFSDNLLSGPDIISNMTIGHTKTQVELTNVFKETITKEFMFPNNSDQKTLSISNITGGINVQGYDGNLVMLKIEKTITAPTEIELEKGINDVNIRTKEFANSYYVYLESPYSEFEFRNKQLTYKNDCGDYACHEYTFQLDYTIKVPQGINLHLSTINGGNITVENLTSENLVLRHTSGSIDLKNIAGATEASTVSGGIKASYAKNPTNKSSYRTISGDIVINLQEALDARVSYEIQDGEMISGFEAQKIKKSTLKIGNGTVDFNFKVLSGNVYLNKI